MAGVRCHPAPRSATGVPARPPRPSRLPPLNFPERGPSQAPGRRRLIGVSRGCDIPPQEEANGHGTPRRAEPVPAVPPGISHGKVTNGHQSTDPTGAGGPMSHQNLLPWPRADEPLAPRTRLEGNHGADPGTVRSLKRQNVARGRGRGKAKKEQHEHPGVGHARRDQPPEA